MRRDINIAWAFDLAASNRGDGVPELDEATAIAKEHCDYRRRQGAKPAMVVAEVAGVPVVPLMRAGWDDAVTAIATAWLRLRPSFSEAA